MSNETPDTLSFPWQRIEVLHNGTIDSKHDGEYRNPAWGHATEQDTKQQGHWTDRTTVSGPWQKNKERQSDCIYVGRQ